MESKHSQNNFTVNVFSITEIYMPPEFGCQAFSSSFVLDRAGKRIPRFSPSALDLRPAAVCHLSGPFSQGDKLIDGKVFVGLYKPVGPVHIEAYYGVVSEAKVQPGIVARIETGLTQNALSLRFPAIMGQNTRSYRTSIGLNALEFDLYPVLSPLEIVAQQRGVLIQINDEHVDVAVIVEIPERAPATGVCLGDAWSCSFDQLFERVISQIAKDRPRGLVCVLR